MNLPTRSEILSAVNNAAVTFRSPEIKGSTIIKTGSQLIPYSGGYSLVFPIYSKDNRKKALRCWIKDIGDAKLRSKAISDYIKRLNVSCFCEFEYIEEAILINGRLTPAVLMDWVEGTLLKDYIEKHLFTNPGNLLLFLENFKRLMYFFHVEGIAHGDLQHENIFVKDDGTIVLIDYDSMFIPALENMSDNIKGRDGYQHPARQFNRQVNPKLDYFSELVIYLSVLIFLEAPHLWSRFAGQDYMLFSKEDLQNPDLSPLFNTYFNSPNKTIAFLTRYLAEQSQKKDIQDLEPIEKILRKDTTTIISTVIDKWEGGGAVVGKAPLSKPDTKSIIQKFSNE